MKFLTMLQKIISIFYPNVCISCFEHLLNQEKFLCLNCKNNLPKLDIENPKENQIKGVFYGKVPIENAISFLIFRKQNSTQKLIHELKYHNNKEIGSFLGNWFGNILKEKKWLTDIDIVISVPLHPKKLKKRGYNQVDLFAKTLSEILKTDFVSDILVRTSEHTTQTFYNRFKRFENSKTLFCLLDDSYFENKHVLLVDDVITTGATLVSCCEELLKTKKIKISIATMAYTEHN